MSRILKPLMLTVLLFSGSGCRTGSPAFNSTSSGQTESEEADWRAAEKENHIVKRRTVTAQYESLAGKQVIRFQNDLVVIVISVDDVVGLYDEYFETYPSERYETWAHVLQQESDVEYAYEDLHGWHQRALSSLIATLLDRGKALVKLRSNGEIISEIEACEYSDIKGPLDGDAGRVYFFKDGRQFYGVTETWY